MSSLDRRIVALAVPAAGSAMLQVIHRAVDMYWLGRLGTDALASIAVSMITVWMFAALGTLVGVGLTALVARYVGAGRPDAARYVGRQGLLWSGAIGLVAGVVGWALTPYVFTAANAAPAVAEAGTSYTRIFWGGGVFVLLQQAGDAVFRGHGNTRVPFLVAVLSLLANVVLDPLLIHGWGPVPALGVPGAAWATLLATVLGVVLLLAALVRRGHLARAQPPEAEMRLVETTRLGAPGALGLDRAVLLRMARVGTPLAASGLFFTSIYLVIHRIAADAGGAAAQAGLGIGHTGEGVAYVLSLGWSAAASALVGQCLGAGDAPGAERVAWRAVLQCAVLCLAWALVLFFLAEDLASVLTLQREAGLEARAHAASYFRIVAFCLVPQAMEIVLDGAFGGAGLTLPPMVISSVFSLLRIPLALLLAFPLGLGVDGIWWTIAATAALRGLVAGAWFLRGTWKTRTV